MQSQVNLESPLLYGTDYQRWLDQTVQYLKSRDFSHLDLEPLIEEIESLGKRDKRALLSRSYRHLI